MKVHGTPGPGKGPVLFRAMTKCDCGCGLKDRFEFRVNKDSISIDDPVVIKALIDEMIEGYRLLFPDGEPPRDEGGAPLHSV